MGVCCSFSVAQWLPGSLFHHSEEMDYHTAGSWTWSLLRKIGSTRSTLPIGSNHHQHGNQGVTDTAEPQPRMNWDMVRKIVKDIRYFLCFYILILNLIQQYPLNKYFSNKVYFNQWMNKSVMLYQFLQSLMMLSPGFANCQSNPPGHTHDVLVESRSPAQRVNQRDRTKQWTETNIYCLVQHTSCIPLPVSVCH